MNHLCCGTTPRQYLVLAKTPWAVEGLCYGSRIYMDTFCDGQPTLLSQNVTSRHVFHSCPRFFRSSCFPRCVFVPFLRLNAERLISTFIQKKASSLTLRNVHNALPARDLSSDIPPQVCVSVLCFPSAPFLIIKLVQCNATCSPILTTLQNCTSWTCACTEENAQAVEVCGDCVAAVVPLSTVEVQSLLDGTFSTWSFPVYSNSSFFFPRICGKLLFSICPLVDDVHRRPVFASCYSDCMRLLPVTARNCRALVLSKMVTVVSLDLFCFSS